MSGRTHAYGAVLTAVTTAAALLASAACSSPSAPDSSSNVAAGQRTVRPVDGCGAKSWTDPKDLSPN
ncbi:hypothetical protein L0P92_42665, partial [Streptomyces muensis]|nr:hypothetical protein [Streptomyces muensis]